MSENQIVYYEVGGLYPDQAYATKKVVPEVVAILLKEKAIKRVRKPKFLKPPYVVRDPKRARETMARIRELTNRLAQQRYEDRGVAWREYLGRVQPVECEPEQGIVCPFCGNDAEFRGTDSAMWGTQDFTIIDGGKDVDYSSYDSEIGAYDEVECAVCGQVLWVKPETWGVVMLVSEFEIEVLAGNPLRIFVGRTVEDACAQAYAQLLAITDGSEPAEEMARIAALPSAHERFKALADALDEGYVIDKVERRLSA